MRDKAGGTVLLIVYLVYLFLSYFLVLQIFRLTTYHADFAKGFPLLLAYSILCGFVFFRLGLAAFFFWQILASLILFARGWSKQARSARVSFDALASNPATSTVFRLSMASTKGHYWLSVAIYLVVFSVSFLYFYNRL